LVSQAYCGAAVSRDLTERDRLASAGNDDEITRPRLALTDHLVGSTNSGKPSAQPSVDEIRKVTTA
jgi:hypothetical protein